MSTESNAYKLILDELNEAEVLYADRYCSMLTVSVGAHLFNQMNKRKKIYWAQRLLVDTRIHNFLVCPSGMGKTFHMRQFVDEGTGILYGVIPCVFEGPTTEAGWVGTIKFVDGEAVPVMGAAHEYSNTIVAVEEFGAILETMQLSYSRTLHPQLLTSLESGMVRKRLGPGKLSYETGVTLWTGDRPSTFNLASGMGRRLTFLTFYPTRRDLETMREYIRRGENVRYNPMRMGTLKKVMSEKKTQIEQIESLTYDGSVYDLLNKLKVMPYEEIMYKRILIGYNLMAFPVKSQLTVYADDEGRKLCEREFLWRKEIKRGADISQVLTIIRDYNGIISRQELLDRLSEYGVFFNEAVELINRMIKYKIVFLKEGKIESRW